MPLKPRKQKLTPQQVRDIERQNAARKQIQISSGVNASQAERILRAQGNRVNIQKGQEIGVDLGDKKSEDFVVLGDLDPSKGVIVADPITKQPTSVIGKDNFVYNPDGTPTNRTKKHLGA